MKTDRASVQEEAQAAAEDGFGYWSKLLLALLAEKEVAERQTALDTTAIAENQAELSRLRRSLETAEAARDASQAAAKLWNESLDKAWDDAHARNKATVAARKGESRG